MKRDISLFAVPVKQSDPSTHQYVIDDTADRSASSVTALRKDFGNRTSNDSAETIHATDGVLQGQPSRRDVRIFAETPVTIPGSSSIESNRPAKQKVGILNRRGILDNGLAWLDVERRQFAQKLACLSRHSRE